MLHNNIYRYSWRSFLSKLPFLYYILLQLTLYFERLVSFPVSLFYAYFSELLIFIHTNNIQWQRLKLKI